MAAVVLVLGVPSGFMPLSVQSSNAVPINCGSAFVPATINVLVSGERSPGSVQVAGNAPQDGVFQQCDRRRVVERAIAIALVAAGMTGLITERCLTRRRA